MRLFTIQPFEVFNIIMQQGEFVCDETKSKNVGDFKNAYDWLIAQMDKKNIPHPEGVNYPIWAWHTYDWKNEYPDTEELDEHECVCIELDVDDREVLLSDYNDWHYVLNNSYNDKSLSREEYEDEMKWYDNLTSDEKERIKVESWEQIFNLTPINTDWRTKARYIQATVWKIRKENIVSVTLLQ